ncbi:hypothetical protein CHLNCDRAFT_136592 [Chlorella variabilis]|uniref:Uncharacterized protein n=1 Tax=Chlorella variabilis TaxID=554065 RepID=E1ZUD6_CHLVA|nr:hypothetical protein CHLNCDRAFT_136592 [Chlorella variabilis]EFN50560.1 hypothetical protein CHLNCDRAFT_136592 [Chlorella variabilis]|eukprot:XP_005842692.1 hypothetical protein CHLNCDRAFT_136592 [Chlorella variabilis]
MGLPPYTHCWGPPPLHHPATLVAGIFGMNLRSTLEMSVVGFWGTTAMIILGAFWVFWVILNYTRRKRIV